MAFFSQIIGRPVIDVDGKQVGVVKDVVARLSHLPHPIVEAVMIQHAGEMICLPYSALAALLSPAIPLKKNFKDVQPYTPGEGDIYLARDVLDKQIIDTDGARVVRVNDLELLRVNGSVVVSNVDVGTLGILRRIGLGKLSERIATFFKIKALQSYISWDVMEVLQQDQFMRLKVPVQKMKELHPADIAEIVSDMNRLQGSQFLEAFDAEQLADALEEVEPEFQASLVEGMDDEKVADVLGEMAPDEAADLLAELPKARSKGLLELMQDDEAADVRKLLAYPEDSAGGIMTTEYVAIRPYLTAEQAIQALRDNADEAETIDYVYVTDEEEHLVGVFSLSTLILADPAAPVTKFMKTHIIDVDLLEEQDKVAQMIAKYDLLAIPVVDAEKHLHGIVTADDALDKIIPTAWKKRLPRFYR